MSTQSFVDVDHPVHIFPDLDKLSHAAAVRVAELAAQAVSCRGAFHVALSGGATPRHLYQRLAQKPFASEIDWSSVHIYFGDERCVPPDHPDSNYGMVESALLAHVPIPRAQIHRIEAELAYVRQRAAAYARVLESHLPVVNGTLQFDLVLLGLGPDGHIASLFPATGSALSDKRPVTAVYADSMHAWRISITLPVINHARNILLLAPGAGKAAILGRVFRKAPSAPLLPVQRIKPQGILEWYLDQAAAAQLPP
ncbi:MAG: 6-phosphogluconolactonase [Proteobacteria bacterium]|nr:6-phosphogluconolactonase [Pseudomonadota bacterium]